MSSYFEGTTLETLGVDAVEAFVNENNVRSIRLLERLGFQNVGRKRHVVNDLDAELLVYRLDKGNEEPEEAIEIGIGSR